METELTGIQKAAILLLSLDEAQAMEIVRRLPPDAAEQIDLEVDAMRHVSAEVRREVLRGFCDATQNTNGKRTIATMADVLDRAQPTLDRDIQPVRRLQHMFEDLLLMEDACVRLVLQEVDDETLSMALRTACEAMRRKVLRNVDEQQERVIRDKMHFMEPLRVSEVEAAQERIADAMQRLIEDGTIGSDAPCAKDAV